MNDTLRRFLRLPLRVTLPLVVALVLLVTASASLLSAWQNALARLNSSADTLLRTEMHRLIRGRWGGHGSCRRHRAG